jgi:hypothetical protein
MEFPVAIPDVVAQQRFAGEAQCGEHRQRIVLVGGQFHDQLATSGTHRFDQCVARKSATHPDAAARRIDNEAQLAHVIGPLG